MNRLRRQFGMTMSSDESLPAFEIVEIRFCGGITFRAQQIFTHMLTKVDETVARNCTCGSNCGTYGPPYMFTEL